MVRPISRESLTNCASVSVSRYAGERNWPPIEAVAGTGVRASAPEGRMNQSDFEQQLKTQGFTEVELQTLAPRPGKGRHRHLFEIHGLVISGAFVVQQRGDPVVYRPGE